MCPCVCVSPTPRSSWSARAKTHGGAGAAVRVAVRAGCWSAAGARGSGSGLEREARRCHRPNRGPGHPRLHPSTLRWVWSPHVRACGVPPTRDSPPVSIRRPGGGGGGRKPVAFVEVSMSHVQHWLSGWTRRVSLRGPPISLSLSLPVVQTWGARGLLPCLAFVSLRGAE